MRAIAVFVTAISLAPVSLAADGARRSVCTDEGEIGFALSLPKAEYVEGEPVIATLALTNRAAVPRRLAEAEVGYTVSYFVSQSRGDRPLPRRKVTSREGAPSDYGWVFEADESRCTHTDIQADYDSPIPAGDYMVHAVYWVTSAIRDVWHGKIETAELFFSVVPAGAANLQTAKAFGEFSRKATAPKAFAEQSIAPLETLKEPSRGEFAKYAGFWLALARHASGDRQGFVTEIRQYIAAHADVPYYGQRAILALGVALYGDGQYADAHRAFEKLQDGYWRMDWLRKCDAKLAQK